MVDFCSVYSNWKIPYKDVQPFLTPIKNGGICGACGTSINREDVEYRSLVVTDIKESKLPYEQVDEIVLDGVPVYIKYNNVS